MGLAVVIFCCLIVLQFPSYTAPSYNSVFHLQGYEHRDEKNVSSNAYGGQSISNMKELLDGDLVPIRNYSQPLGPIYFLRRRGGRRRGRGGRYQSRGGTSSSCETGSSNGTSHNTCESIAAPLSWNQTHFRLFTAVGVAIYLAL